MCLKIAEADGNLNPQLLDFFLKGNLSLDRSGRPKPAEWWPDAGWHDMRRLATLVRSRAPHPSLPLASQRLPHSRTHLTSQPNKKGKRK